MNSQDIPFRLMNYRPRGDTSGRIQVGLELDERILPLEALMARHPAARRLVEASTASELTPGVQGLLTRWEHNLAALIALTAFVRSHSPDDPLWRRSQVALADVSVLPPVIHPSRMLFAGTNYTPHVGEDEPRKAATASNPYVNDRAVDRPATRPYVFEKAPYYLSGPYDAVIHPAGDEKLTWEGELALIIGKRGKHIPAAQAMEHVAGFTIASDYSLRSMHRRADRPGPRADSFSDKNFATAACLGPYLVPKDFVHNYRNLDRKLTVNGVVKEGASTAHLLVEPAEIIALASSITTLEPGDVIATGLLPDADMPGDEYLHIGDVVEAEIAGLGRQRNLIVSAADHHV